MTECSLNFNNISLSLYYTMRWVYILVTSNVPKLVKKCNQLAFLPNAQCNIEKLHCVFLALGNFLAFACVFGYQHVSIQNASENARKTSNNA